MHALSHSIVVQHDAALTQTHMLLPLTWPTVWFPVRFWATWLERRGRPLPPWAGSSSPCPPSKLSPFSWGRLTRKHPVSNRCFNSQIVRKCQPAASIRQHTFHLLSRQYNFSPKAFNAAWYLQPAALQSSLVSCLPPRSQCSVYSCLPSCPIPFRSSPSLFLGSTFFIFFSLFSMPLRSVMPYSKAIFS